MFIYESKNGNQKVAVGTVTEVKSITKDGAERAIVKIKDWRDEELAIFFNDHPGEAPGKQLAQRVKNAKLKVGSFIAALVIKSENQKDATGLGFQFSGMFNLKEFNEDGTESEINIIVGPGCNPRQVKEGMYAISMPVKNRGGETDWYSVSFFDNDKYKNAERAKTLFQDKRRTCCVRCGALRENEKDGKTYKNLTAYRLEMGPFAENKEA